MTLMHDSRDINASTVGQQPGSFQDPGSAATVLLRSAAAPIELYWREQFGRRPNIELALPGGLTTERDRLLSETVGNLNRMLAVRITGAGYSEGARVKRALPYLVQLVEKFGLAPRFFPLADGGLLAKFVLASGATVQVEVDEDDDIVVLVQTSRGMWSGYDHEIGPTLDEVAAPDPSSASGPEVVP